jgi:hypothetical protein
MQSIESFLPFKIFHLIKTIVLIGDDANQLSNLHFHSFHIFFNCLHPTHFPLLIFRLYESRKREQSSLQDSISGFLNRRTNPTPIGYLQCVSPQIHVLHMPPEASQHVLFTHFPPDMSRNPFCYLTFPHVNLLRSCRTVKLHVFFNLSNLICRYGPGLLSGWLISSFFPTSPRQVMYLYGRSKNRQSFYFTIRQIEMFSFAIFQC